jgi:hypothetical protein
MTEAPKAADFLTDAEIAQRWGICDKTARRAIKALEKAGGFPKKDALFGGKRYWPAVDAFMKRRAGLSMASVPTDGEENWDDEPATPRKRARTPLAASR